MTRGATINRKTVKRKRKTGMTMTTHNGEVADDDMEFD